MFFAENLEILLSTDDMVSALLVDLHALAFWGQILMHILLKIMFVPVHFQNLQVVL